MNVHKMNTHVRVRVLPEPMAVLEIILKHLSKRPAALRAAMGLLST